MDSVTENVEENLLIPPPPGTFKDRDELVNYVKEFALNHGYAMIIRKTKKGISVVLSCDRAGTTRRRNPGELKRKRKTPSRLINCPFEVVGKKDEDEDVWVLRVRNGEHNHEPMRDISEHPSSRRFKEDEAMKIKELMEAGLKPREVLETLKQSNPALKSTPKHVYNLATKIRLGKFKETSLKTSPNPGPEASSNSKRNPQKVSNFIGGKSVESEGHAFADVVNPATLEVVSQVPSSTYEEFKSAVLAAKQAFSSWRETSFPARQRIMIKFQELIRRDIDKLALMISTEQGETIKRAHASILHGLEMVELACGNMALQIGEFVPNTSSGIAKYSIREPLGVSAGICQCNYPAVVPLWMFPVSIICGNTFVLKPSEECPGVSLKLAELAKEAGLPDGVLNIVHGGDEVIDHICGDDDIKAIAFVGSYMTGKHIYAEAAAKGIRVEANIRSSNQAVVMPDASMDTTIDALVAAGFGAGGDPCMSLSSIIFVGHSVPWEDELVKRGRDLKVYGGADERADLGPVTTEEVKASICRSVQDAVEGGASLILDGRHVIVPGYENGNFVGPTILSGITASMECFKDGIFGPVMLCMEVHSLEEAIAMVNKDRLKNGASIFATSAITAKKFQREVESASVGINVPVSIALPFSSAGMRGDLNFQGKAGVQFYTQIKLVTQQWRGLTNKRIPTTTSRSDCDRLNQVNPATEQLSSDLSSHNPLLPRSESSDVETFDLVRPVNIPPANDSLGKSYVDSMSTSTVLAPDFNLCLPETSNRTETLPPTSLGFEGVPECTNMDSMPSIAQYDNDAGIMYSNPALTAGARCGTSLSNVSDSTLLEADSRVPQVPVNFFTPLPEEANNTLQRTDRTDATSHSTNEIVYMPALYHGNEDANNSSRRVDSTMHPSYWGPCMSTSQGLDGLTMCSDAEIQHAPSSSQGQWNQMM